MFSIAFATDLSGPDLNVCKKYKHKSFEAFSITEEYWTYCCTGCCDDNSEVEDKECTKTYCDKKCPESFKKNNATK